MSSARPAAIHPAHGSSICGLSDSRPRGLLKEGGGVTGGIRQSGCHYPDNQADSCNVVDVPASSAVLYRVFFAPIQADPQPEEQDQPRGLKGQWARCARWAASGRLRKEAFGLSTQQGFRYGSADDHLTDRTVTGDKKSSRQGFGAVFLTGITAFVQQDGKTETKSSLDKIGRSLNTVLGGEVEADHYQIIFRVVTRDCFEAGISARQGGTPGCPQV